MKLLFSKNRHSLIVFLIMLLVMLVVISASAWNTKNAYEKYSVMKKQFTLERLSKYKELDNEDYLVANLPDYRTLEGRGVIGSVDQIVWIEAFEGIRQKMQLTEFTYELAQPEIVTVRSGDGVGLQEITIDLRIGFSHDEALFEFFSLLEDSVSVNYEITQLEIDRVSFDRDQQNATSYPVVNLTAISQISWLSIITPSPGNADKLRGV